MSAVAEPVTTRSILAEKIRSKTARVGIVGLGYVGLPLAVEFAKAGFNVTDHTRIDNAEIVEKTRIVIDTRTALNDVASEKIVRL